MADNRQPVATGGCQCGAVRYALYAMPEGSVCHCRMCQKAVGGPVRRAGQARQGRYGLDPRHARVVPQFRRRPIAISALPAARR